jgi:hypothetical protein
MNRRNFLGTLIGGVAAAAAVRTWPFRVYSFPTELTHGDIIGWQIWGSTLGSDQFHLLDEIHVRNGVPLEFRVPPGAFITGINNLGRLRRAVTIPRITAVTIDLPFEA